MTQLRRVQVHGDIASKRKQLIDNVQSGRHRRENVAGTNPRSSRVKPQYNIKNIVRNSTLL